MPLIFLLYALFASVFVIAKIALESSSPLFLVGSRMLLAGVILLGYQWITNRESLRLNKQTTFQLFQLALFNIYLTNAFEFWGLQYLTSFKTCFIYSLSPFLSALFSYIVFHEKMTGKKWLGMLIGFLGFLPILFTHTTGETEGGGIGIFSLPELAVIMATVCSMYGWVVLRKLVTDQGCNPITANSFAMLAGGAMAIVHSSFVEEWNPIPVSNMESYLSCMVLLIIISNFICYNLYGYLLTRFTATCMSFAGWTTPVFTALLGWLILGEVVTWHFYVSALIVLIGLFFFYQEELKQGYHVREVGLNQ